MKYKIVDLFAGVGGFHMGFEKAGYKTILATDFDEDCALFNEKNTPWIPFIHGDIRNLDKKTINQYINGEEIDVLIGGPPCQGFSTIGARISADEKKRRQKDERNLLFKEYIRVLKILNPKVFLMENVVGMLTLDEGSYFQMIKNEFSKLEKEMGYKFDVFILDAVNYGVPQYRKRVFIFGNRINLTLKPPEQTHGDGMLYKPYVTVGDVIGDLAGKEKKVLNHIPLNHKEKNILRYKYIPEGGRLPEDKLPPELYRKNFGNTFKRLHRNEPSLTMVPGHNAFPIHPWLDRSLTVREAARIQTFDDNLEFIGARHKQCMQVGNAVPPLLAEAWAKYIKKGLNEYYARKSRPKFIDLFSGAGGFLRGFIDAGFEPVFSVEKWEPAIETHKLNYPSAPLICKDIKEITNEELKNYKDIDVLIGGPPCQGFSTIGKRIIKDPRNELVFEFIRFVKIIQPKIFLMENVKGLLSSHNGELREIIKNEFERIGYHNIQCKVLCAADYGVPQLRYRVFFMGVRNDIDINIDFPEPTIMNKKDYINVGKAIMDLVGQENKFNNHVPMNHKAIVKERMKYILEGSGLPKEGMPEYLTYGARADFKENKVKNFSHVYKRLHREYPASTMVPGHNAFPLHPTENRSLTVREAARIQTFPDDVIFCGSRQNQCIQVGNAVPVKLAYELAKNIKKYL